MIDFSKISIPPAIAALPKDPRGYPIPFTQFVPKDGSKIDFRVIDPEKKNQAIRERLCGMCGQPLFKTVYFIGGPVSFENQIYSDPAMHLDCATYATKVCPFLSNPKYNAVKSMPKDGSGFEVIEDPIGLQARPKVMLLVRSDGYQIVQAQHQTDKESKVHGLYIMSVNPRIVERF